MSARLWDRVEDAYESLSYVSQTCRNCGSQSRHLAEGDGYCPRCNGEPDEDRNVLATQRACRLAREAQQRRRPDLFDENGVWAPFRGTR